MKTPVMLALAALLGAVMLPTAQAADLGASQAAPTRPEPVYGSHLMTPEERQAHRAKMFNAKTPEEREKIRLEHHEAMQARAKERGLTLPDMPPPRPGRGPGCGRMGQGGCMGAGPGQGPGAGMGPGRPAKP